MAHSISIGLLTFPALVRPASVNNLWRDYTKPAAHGLSDIRMRANSIAIVMHFIPSTRRDCISREAIIYMHAAADERPIIQHANIALRLDSCIYSRRFYHTISHPPPHTHSIHIYVQTLYRQETTTRLVGNDCRYKNYNKSTRKRKMPIMN